MKYFKCNQTFVNVEHITGIVVEPFNEKGSLIKFYCNQKDRAVLPCTISVTPDIITNTIAEGLQSKNTVVDLDILSAVLG